jgi:hypothetical protein
MRIRSTTSAVKMEIRLVLVLSISNPQRWRVSTQTERVAAAPELG